MKQINGLSMTTFKSSISDMYPMDLPEQQEVSDTIKAWSSKSSLEQNNSESELLNLEQACKYFGIKQQTLYNWVCQRKISHYNLGKSLRFTKAQIQEFLDKHHYEAIT